MPGAFGLVRGILPMLASDIISNMIGRTPRMANTLCGCGAPKASARWSALDLTVWFVTSLVWTIALRSEACKTVLARLGSSQPVGEFLIRRDMGLGRLPVYQHYSGED